MDSMEGDEEIEEEFMEDIDELDGPGLFTDEYQEVDEFEQNFQDFLIDPNFRELRQQIRSGEVIPNTQTLSQIRNTYPVLYDSITSDNIILEEILEEIMEGSVEDEEGLGEPFEEEWVDMEDENNVLGETYEEEEWVDMENEDNVLGETYEDDNDEWEDVEEEEEQNLGPEPLNQPTQNITPEDTERINEVIYN